MLKQEALSAGFSVMIEDGCSKDRAMLCCMLQYTYNPRGEEADIWSLWMQETRIGEHCVY